MKGLHACMMAKLLKGQGRHKGIFSCEEIVNLYCVFQGHQQTKAMTRGGMEAIAFDASVK